jgi:hypothetical protein
MGLRDYAEDGTTLKMRLRDYAEDGTYADDDISLLPHPPLCTQSTLHKAPSNRTYLELPPKTRCAKLKLPIQSDYDDRRIPS